LLSGLFGINSLPDMSLLTLVAIVAGFATFVTIAIAALPTVQQYPLPDWMATSATTIVGLINDMYAIFPLFTTALFVVFAFTFLVGLLFFGWHGIRFIIRVVRGARV